MRRVTGIGGIFFKAKNAQVLHDWYRKHLGIDVQEWGGTSFDWKDADGKSTAGTTAWFIEPRESDHYKPSNSSFMVNYRVEDLLSLVKILAEEKVEIIGEVEETEYGKFAWVMDPDGNKVELREPPSGQ